MASALLSTFGTAAATSAGTSAGSGISSTVSDGLNRVGSDIYTGIFGDTIQEGTLRREKAQSAQDNALEADRYTQLARARDRNDYDKSFILDVSDDDVNKFLSSEKGTLAAPAPSSKPKSLSTNALFGNLLAGDFLFGINSGSSVGVNAASTGGTGTPGLKPSLAPTYTKEEKEAAKKKIAENKRSNINETNNFFLSQDVNRIKQVGDANLDLYKKKSAIDLETNWANKYQEFAWGAQRLQPVMTVNAQAQTQQAAVTSNELSNRSDPHVRGVTGQTLAQRDAASRSKK